MMKSIGLIINPKKDIGFVFSKKLITLLQRCGYRVFLHQIAEELKGVTVLEGINFFSAVDAIVTLGGDGTVLEIASSAALYSKPVLAINLGHLGYLSQLEQKDLERVPGILNNNTAIEHRLMLKVGLEYTDGTTEEISALNDVVLGRGIISNMAYVELYSNNEFVYEFHCDGLIFSTPTGSTAYSMSSGGPIADCNLKDIIIFTPVSEHSFFSKSMLFSSSDILSCKVKERPDDTYLIIDGRKISAMNRVEHLTITQSEHTLPLFQPDGKRFYKVLNNKFSDGE